MILYRYTIREHILPFLYSLAVIVFILLMNLAVQLLNKIISKGLPPAIVLELFLIQMGWIIALAIPMSILVATLMTFGRMSADNEITAVKASGRNLFYLIAPVFISSIVLAVLLVFFNNLILPDANHRAANLSSDISRKKPAAFIEPGILIRDFQGYVLRVGKVNSRSGLLRDVIIFSDAPGQDPSTTVADSGYVIMTPDEQHLQLTLYNGETHGATPGTPAEHRVVRFDRQVIFIRNVDSELRRTERDYRGDREKSAQEMLREIEEMKQTKRAYTAQHTASIDSMNACIRELGGLAAARPAATGGADTAGTLHEWARSLGIRPHTVAASIRKEENEATRAARRIGLQDRRISQYLVEVHKKYSIPATCVAFVLVGAPLGIMARHGGLAVGASYSLLFFIIFWSFLIGGESLADRRIIDPAVAMWTGPAVVGLFGIILLVRMIRETTFISSSPLTAFRHKVSGRRSSRHRHPGFVFALLKIARSCAMAPFFILRIVWRTLPVYLIRKFSGYFTGVLGSIAVIFVVIDYISNLNLFENAAFKDVGLYYWYYLPWIILILLPIVVLLASMSAMGSLARNSELTAMRSAGINVWQLTMPLLVLGAFISVASFLFGEMVLPKANYLRRELKEELREGRKERRQGPAQRDFRRNFYYFGNRTTIYHFDEFRTRPDKTKNVWRESFDGSRIAQRVEAASLDYVDGKWYFINGSVRSFDTGSSCITPFDTLADTVLDVSPGEMVVKIKSKEEMSYWELRDFIDKVERQGEKVSTYMAELHFKIALPMMNLFVILIGVSITARMRRKAGAALFGVGLLMVFSYWIVARFALAFAQNGQLKPLVGAWLGNAIFSLLGLVLYRNARQ